jgi:hypothetical protein
VQDKSAVLQSNLQLAVVEHVGERTAEKRQQEFALQSARRGFPVDIEIGRERGIGPELEHVHPPAILAARRHVVRNDVEQQSEPAFVERRLQCGEILRTAGVDLNARGVGDVVSMATAMPAGEDGRGIDVRNSEIAQVVEDRNRIAETKMGVELQTIGRKWNTRRHYVDPWMESFSRTTESSRFHSC